MSFLFPNFLWALSALSIPVAIHLFNFLRPKKVLFSNVRFLRSIKEQTNSSRKLRHFLILLCRLAFLFFLVMAFAQPYLADKGVKAESGKKYVSIYVDNSFSMQTETGDGSALDVALRSAEKIINSYSGNTWFQVFTNDFSGKSQYFYSPEKARDMLAEVRFSNTFRDIPSVIKRQQSAAQTLREGRAGEFFMLSDFQKSTAGNIADVVSDSSRRYYLLPLKPAKTANLFIDSVWLNTPFVKVNENNNLEVSVYNAGNAEATALVLKMFIDEVQVSTASLTVNPGSAARTHFTFSIGTPDAHKCRISIEDRPVIFDNDYYFVLKTAPKIKVMHIYKDRLPYVPKVFSNESLFELKTFPAGNTDYDYFKRADLIVTDGITVLDAGLREALLAALARGASLAIFPGRNADAVGYNALLSGSALRPALAGSDTAKNSNTHSLQNPDIKNPFFEGVFESVAPNTVMPNAAPVFTWPKAGVNLLTYRNGNAFLAESKAGKGKVYLFASPLDAGTKSNFAQHSLFVACMYRIAELSLPGNNRLAFSFQEKNISLPSDTAPGEQAFTLNKGKLSIIPGRHLSDRRLLLELPKTDMEAGYYDLKLGDKTLQTLAINYGSKESRLDIFTPEELKQAISPMRNFRLFDADNDGASAAAYVQHNRGVPLWKQAILLALAFLLAEVLLIRFWKNRPAAVSTSAE
ncbi:MAG: BatA domain-containing protein [Bacteroidota bacterium]